MPGIEPDYTGQYQASGPFAGDQAAYDAYDRPGRPWDARPDVGRGGIPGRPWAQQAAEEPQDNSPDGRLLRIMMLTLQEDPVQQARSFNSGVDDMFESFVERHEDDMSGSAAAEFKIALRRLKRSAKTLSREFNYQDPDGKLPGLIHKVYDRLANEVITVLTHDMPRQRQARMPAQEVPRSKDRYESGGAGGFLEQMVAEQKQKIESELRQTREHELLMSHRYEQTARGTHVGAHANPAGGKGATAVEGSGSTGPGRHLRDRNSKHNPEDSTTRNAAEPAAREGAPDRVPGT